MDPQKCLDDVEAAIRAQHWSDAVEGLINYYQWRLREGFEPPQGDSKAVILGNRLADELDALEEG